MYTPPSRFQQGFSLIEIMIAVAIVAILSMMAVPSFIDKLVRQQINEALPLADIAKAPVASAWSLLKPLPANNKEAGLPVPDKIVSNYISAVTVEDGAIHLTFGNSANGIIKGKTLTLRPAVIEDAPIVPVAWVCGNAAAPDKMVVKGQNKTNITASYLPLSCRSKI